MQSETWKRWSISLLILVAAFGLYLFSIDRAAPSLTRTNLVLDADIEPMARVIATGHLRTVNRHPLYGIFLGGPGHFLQSVLHDKLLTGTCLCAAMAAVASLAAFWVLDGLLGSKLDALGFSLLASCSASVWLMGSVPETHIFNYASVVLSFWLLGRMGRTRRLGRLTLVAILIAVYMTGITLTNGVYLALAFGIGLFGIAISFRERLRRYATFLGGCGLLFAAASALHLYLEPREVNLLIRPTAFLDTDFIEWSRGLEPGLLPPLARMLLFSGVVASRPQVELVETVDGTQQMIQLAPLGRSELLILSYLVLTVGVLFFRRTNEPFGLPAWLAGASIAFVFAVHLFFFGNGQPFIFSIQTVFPLVVLLALLYRQSRVPVKRLLLGGLISLVIVQNALFMFSIDELLSRRCWTRSKVGDHKICVLWDPSTAP